MTTNNKIPTTYLKIAMCLFMATSAFDSFGQIFQGGSKEIGYQIGTSYYLGDLNPSNPLAGRQHVVQGGYFRHNINARIGIRLQLLQCTSEAWDEDSNNA